MTIHEKRIVKEKIQIDLAAPEGNAFSLLALASNIGKQLKMNPDEIQAILTDMQSADYEHLVTVLDNHFGDYIDIYPVESEEDEED